LFSDFDLRHNDKTCHTDEYQYLSMKQEEYLYYKNVAPMELDYFFALFMLQKYRSYGAGFNFYSLYKDSATVIEVAFLRMLNIHKT
jgi:hypothetical protein